MRHLLTHKVSHDKIELDLGESYYKLHPLKVPH